MGITANHIIIILLLVTVLLLVVIYLELIDWREEYILNIVWIQMQIEQLLKAQGLEPTAEWTWEE